MNQVTSYPTNKTIAGGLAGALTAILVWGVKQAWQIDVPAEIAVAISTVITFVVSYVTPPGESDHIEP